MDRKKRHIRCNEYGAKNEIVKRSAYDLKIDNDFSGQACNVFDVDLVSEMPLQLLQQRQGVMVIAKTHGFARMQGR